MKKFCRDCCCGCGSPAGAPREFLAAWAHPGAILSGMLLVIPAMSVAQVPVDNSLEQFRVGFESLTAYSDAISTYASRLFLLLFLAEFVIRAGQITLQGSSGFSTISSFITMRILLGGMFWFFLQQGSNVALMVVDFFRGAALQAGGLDFAVSVTDVLDRGIMTGSKLMESMSIWSPASSTVVFLAAVMIVVLFAMIAGALFVVLMEFYIISIAGIALLAFGGASITRDIAMAYFRFAIASGFKLFVMQVIVSFGVDVMDTWLDDLKENNTDILAIISVLWVLWFLAWRVPDMAGRMIHGTSLNSSRYTSPIDQASTLGQGYRGVASLAGAIKENTRSVSQLTQATHNSVAARTGGADSISGRVAGGLASGVVGTAALGATVASGRLFSSADRQGNGNVANASVPGPHSHGSGNVRPQSTDGWSQDLESRSPRSGRL